MIIICLHSPSNYCILYHLSQYQHRWKCNFNISFFILTFIVSRRNQAWLQHHLTFLIPCPSMTHRSLHLLVPPISHRLNHLSPNLKPHKIKLPFQIQCLLVLPYLLAPASQNLLPHIISDRHHRLPSQTLLKCFPLRPLRLLSLRCLLPPLVRQKR